MVLSYVPVWTRALRLFGIVSFVALSQSTAPAQTTSTWQAPGVASWNDPANWTSGVPILAADHAIFNPLFPASDTTVVVIDPTTTIGTLTYNNPFQIALTAPTMAFDGDGAAALVDILDGRVLFNSGSYVLATDLDLSVASGSTATVGIGFSPAASFTGPGGLNVFGDGEVILSGDNTYTGATHIQSGKLSVHRNNSLGTGTGTDLDGTFIHAGGKLEIASEAIRLPDEKIIVDGGTLTGSQMTLDGPVQMNAGTISGTGWTINGPFSAAGGILTSSGWTLAGPTTFTGELTARGTGRFVGDIDGPGDLLIDSVSNIQLFGDNTYTGQTTVIGTLTARTDTALGAGTSTDADGTTVITGGQLVLSGSNPANEKITLDGGILSGGGTLGGPVQLDGGRLTGRTTLNGPLGISSGTIAGNVVINGQTNLNGSVFIEAGSNFINGGTVVNGAIAGNGDITVNGLRGESVNLFGASTFQGSVTLASSQITVHHPQALGDITNTVNVDNGDLQLNRSVDQTLSLRGGRIVLNSDEVFHGRIDFMSGTITPGNTIEDPIYQGQIVLTGPGEKVIAGNNGLKLNGDISGDGPLTLVSDIQLNSANTYTGHTSIPSRIVQLNHAEGLGSPSRGTTVTNGILRINASHSFEPILADNSVIEFRADNFSGPITLDHSRIDSEAFSSGTPRILSGLLTIQGSGTINNEERGIEFAGGITGNGLLVLENSDEYFILSAPSTFGGEFVIQDVLTIDIPTTLPGNVWLVTGGIDAKEDVVIPDLRIAKWTGSLLSSLPGKTITVTDLDPSGMTLDADIAGTDPLVVDAGRRTTFHRVGDNYEGGIEVARGLLIVTADNSLGSPLGATTVTGRHDAAIMVERDVTVTEDIYLNNAKGYSYGGALISRDLVDGSGRAIIDAGVDLGAIGSYVGGINDANSRLRINGEISGGTLTAVGNSNHLEIAGNNNTYTGQTVLRSGRVHVIDEGTLTTTSGVVIGDRFNSFILDNSGSHNLDDRIADGIPIQISGGSLVLQAADAAFSEETVGVVTLNPGYSTIETRRGDFIGSVDSTGNLTVTELVRVPGATVNLLATPSDSLQISFVNPPVLDDGIIGGWATLEGEQFATTGALGVEPLTNTVAFVASAGPSDNVDMTDSNFIVSDKTINSLRMSRDAESLDLRGFTLTVESGGIILLDDPVISDGLITSHADTGELFLYKNGTIGAGIIDHPDGPIGVTVAGGQRSLITLSGPNTYTGATAVTDDAELKITSASSIPDNNDVMVYGGDYNIAIIPSAQVDLGKLSLDGNGAIIVSRDSSTIDADSYDFRSGVVQAILTGDGTMTKSTEGTVRLVTPSINYQGAVVVDDGILQVERGNALGHGPITVNPGGRLTLSGNSNADAPGTIMLNGGELSSTNHQASIANAVDVSAESTIYTALPLDDEGRLRNTSIELRGPLTGDADLHVIGVGGRAQISGDTSGFTGDILVTSSTLEFINPGAIIDGTITATKGSSLEIVASDTPADIRLIDSSIRGSTMLKGSLAISGISRYEGVEDSRIDATTRFDSGSALYIENVLTPEFASDVLVGNDVTVLSVEGGVAFTGTIHSDHPEASLNIVPERRLEYSASIHVNEAQSLSILLYGEPMPLDLNQPDMIVSGGGTLLNDLSLSGGAQMSPGNSASRFTVDGDYTQRLGAILQIELGGTATGQFDVLAVTGIFNPGGTFEVSLIDGYVPRAGDTFPVLDFHSVAAGASFDLIQLPELGAGMQWDASGLLTGGQLRVVPEPAGMLWVGACLLMVRRQGKRA